MAAINEHVNTSEAIGELATALAQYQATAQNPANSAKNPFLKNKYAPLNAILGEVRPALAKRGLSLSQLVCGVDKIGVTTILAHTSGQYIAGHVALTPDSSKGLSTAQNAGVVITYLRRYAVQAILGISGEDDTDGHEEKTPAAKPAPVSDELTKAASEFKAALDALDKIAPDEAVQGWRKRGAEVFKSGDYKRLRELAGEVRAEIGPDVAENETELF